MKQALNRAISNVVAYGDTDIFPYPIENRIVTDAREIIIDHLLNADSDFDTFITKYPPANYGTLAPAGYTGFRWATQIDPLWNIFFLALVIKIGGKIEAARLPKSTQTVFSYRFVSDDTRSDLFEKDLAFIPLTHPMLIIGISIMANMTRTRCHNTTVKNFDSLNA